MAAAGRKSIQFFYDVASPYSFLGFETLCRYRTRWPIDLHLTPVFLSGLLGKFQGYKPGKWPKAKADYHRKDLQRLGEIYRVPIKQLPNIKLMFKPGTLQAQRFLTAIDMKYPKHLEEVSRQLWLRVYQAGAPIFEPEDFKAAAECAGMNKTDINDTLLLYNDTEVKERLKATTNEAFELGAMGVPTMVFRDTEGKEHAVWGSDRIALVGFLIGEKYHGPLPELSKY